MSIEQIHNYYERLVVDEVIRRVKDLADVTGDDVADMACVALNRLPARYVRHDVDLMFYLTESERHHNEVSINQAIDTAVALVLGRRHLHTNSTDGADPDSSVS